MVDHSSAPPAPESYLRKRAKNLKNRFAKGDAEAIARAHAVYADLALDKGEFSLMRAQHVIAVELGFESWSALNKATPAEQRAAIGRQRQKPTTTPASARGDEKPVHARVSKRADEKLVQARVSRRDDATPVYARAGSGGGFVVPPIVGNAEVALRPKNALFESRKRLEDMVSGNAVEKALGIDDNSPLSQLRQAQKSLELVGGDHGAVATAKATLNGIMGAGVHPEPLSAIASIAAKMDAFNSKSLGGIAAMTAKFDAANNKGLGSIASIAAKMDAFNSKSLSGIAAMTAKMDGFAPKSLDAITAKMDDLAGAKAQRWTEKSKGS
jgi:hypothetical protein